PIELVQGLVRDLQTAGALLVRGAQSHAHAQAAAKSCLELSHDDLAPASLVVGARDIVAAFFTQHLARTLANGSLGGADAQLAAHDLGGERVHVSLVR